MPNHSARIPRFSAFNLLTSKVILVIGIGFVCAQANAQGCAERPSYDYEWRCQSNGQECYDQSCVDGGKDSDYCYEGYGTCCGTDITTANVECDVEECCSGPGDCATGCAVIPGVLRPIGLSLGLDNRPVSRRDTCHQPAQSSKALARLPYFVPVGDQFNVTSAAVQGFLGKAPRIEVNKDITTTNVQSQFFGPAFNRVACDDLGNLYARRFQARSKGTESIQEISRNGAVIRSFKVEDANIALTVSDFSLGPQNDVYMLGWSTEHSHVGSRVYVARFREDGSFRSSIQIASEEFFPSSLSVFKNGDFLITGRQGRGDNTPFTGVFTSNGKLIAKVSQPEDEDLRRRAEASDPDLHEGGLYGNTAVGLGRAVTGSDGNVYVMRKTSPTLIYVISANGTLLRKFRVNAVDSTLMPDGLQVSTGRVAISFSGSDGSRLVKVVDLKGNEVMEYRIGAAFGAGELGCYNPPVLTFLSGDGNDIHGHMLIQNVQQK